MNDFDEEWTEGLFSVNGRDYEDISETINWIQTQVPTNDILVMATLKHKTFPIKDANYFVTNYHSDQTPYNEYGNICGHFNLNPETNKEIIWSRDA